MTDFYWYLFQLILHLHLNFNCCNSFALSLIDKVITGIKNFVSVVASVVSWFATVSNDRTQFADKSRIRSISQLISGFSRVLEKLLKYFNYIYSNIYSSIYSNISLNLNESKASLPTKSTITPALFKTGSSL